MKARQTMTPKQLSSPGMGRFGAALFCLLICLGAVVPAVRAQNGSQLTLAITGTKKISLALPDFTTPQGGNQALAMQQIFHKTLWNDLYQSGLVVMISPSLYPAGNPGQPSDLNAASLQSWASPPSEAQRLVFGNVMVVNGVLQIEGYLYDVTQPASPFVLGKRYTDQPSPAAAEMMAHEFANAIVAALGGGVGIATTKIAYISNRTGHKEVWLMDYDGQNKRQITHLHSICYSPRISPSGHKIAFISYASGTPEIWIYSLISNRYVRFPRWHGFIATPAWSPDGKKLAFSADLHHTGYPEIYTVHADGYGLKQLTFSRSVNIGPVWNPKTGAQIAFESDRSGLPQIYTMDADGTNQQVLTTGGYAVSPAWSPNGQLLAFSWRRTGGGEGNGGAYDIYLMDLATRNYIQLTHNGQRNDFPSWAPDGRHVVFTSGRPGHWQLFTMLADGSSPAELTSRGSNQMPNWSQK